MGSTFLHLILISLLLRLVEASPSLTAKDLQSRIKYDELAYLTLYELV